MSLEWVWGWEGFICSKVDPELLNSSVRLSSIFFTVGSRILKGKFFDSVLRLKSNWSLIFNLRESMKLPLFAVSDFIWGFNLFCGLIISVLIWSELTNDIGDLTCEVTELICRIGGVDLVELPWFNRVGKLNESCFVLEGFSELRFESPALIETFCVGDQCLDDCLMGVSEQETKEQGFEFGFEHTHKGLEGL